MLCRKVAPDGLVTWETHRYSVPPAYVGRTVEVHSSHQGAIQISHQGTLIATHPRAPGQHQVDVDPLTPLQAWDGPSPPERPRPDLRDRALP